MSEIILYFFYQHLIPPFCLIYHKIVDLPNSLSYTYLTSSPAPSQKDEIGNIQKEDNMSKTQEIIDYLNQEMPEGFESLSKREEVLYKLIEALKEVDEELQELQTWSAKLKVDKIKATKKIIELMGKARWVLSEEGTEIMVDVVHYGERSYPQGPYMVKVYTERDHKIDVEAYEKVKDRLRPLYNPVKETISYRTSEGTLNQIYKDIYKHGSHEDMMLVRSFLIAKDATPKVEIKPNV